MSGNTNKNDPQNEIDAARARARAYKEKHAGEGEDESSHPLQSAAAPKGPRSEAQWSDAVSQAIEEAMRKGEFANLPGRGKPLRHGGSAFPPRPPQRARGVSSSIVLGRAGRPGATPPERGAARRAWVRGAPPPVRGRGAMGWGRFGGAGPAGEAGESSSSECSAALRQVGARQVVPD